MLDRIRAEEAEVAAESGKRKIRIKLSAQAEKYVRRDAPVEARRMAARGALPLEPVDLVTTLFVLSHDTESDVREAARASLVDLPPGVLGTVARGPAHGELLDYLAHLHREDSATCEEIALNPAVLDETLAYLASLPLRSVVDIISHNQERLRCGERIVESLGGNRLTGRAAIQRILSFLGSEAEGPVGQDEEEDLSEEAAQRAIAAMLGEDSTSIARLLASEKSAEDEKTELSLFAAIQNMNVMEKIKLARTGGKEARTLLLKDRNKIIAVSALQSPKITESEVIAIAQSRSVGEEILRLISTNKDWTRSYKIKLALATNPKTPQPQAVKFLNYLQDRDLRTLMKSRDVPTAISTHARRILTKKGQL
jgi:hypothetical protein